MEEGTDWDEKFKSFTRLGLVSEEGQGRKVEMWLGVRSPSSKTNTDIKFEKTSYQLEE